MKVFLSWSGSRSKEFANMLSDWLCCVIQAARPWVSNRDLDCGSLWFGEINDQLKDTTVGVICLTQENKNRPWILFEAGALAKGLSTARVCTFLIDLDPKDIEDPLAQFNHTFPSKESVLGLVRTLNGTLGSSALDIRILEQVFQTYWPQFESRFKDIIANTEAVAPSKPRPKEDVLGEILENTRTLASKIRKLEYETERSWRQAELELPPSMLRKQARSMIQEGVPVETVLNKLRGRAPMSFIREIIADAEQDRDSPAQSN